MKENSFDQFTRIRRFAIGLGAIAIIASLIYLLLSSEIAKTLSLFPAIAAGIVALLALLLATAQQAKQAQRSKELIQEAQQYEQRHQEQLKHLFKVIQHRKQATDSDVDSDTHNQREPNNKIENSNEEDIYRSLNLKLKKFLIENDYTDCLFSNRNNQSPQIILNSLSKNVSSYIRSLSYSLYINLAMGLFFATLSISVLYILYISPIDIDIIKNRSGTTSYLQLAFPISLQILSLFFLGLYKSTSLEIKYMNNEVTNIELRKAAVAISEDFTEENKLQIAKALINTERNFILKKGETTHHVEQTKKQLIRND